MKKYRSYRGEMGKAVPNLLARDFHEERPIQLWVTGVTAFSLHGSKPSPSPGLDLYNGEGIRYAISERTNYRQVEEVLAKAFAAPGWQRAVLPFGLGLAISVCPLDPISFLKACDLASNLCYNAGTLIAQRERHGVILNQFYASRQNQDFQGIDRSRLYLNQHLGIGNLRPRYITQERMDTLGIPVDLNCFHIRPLSAWICFMESLLLLAERIDKMDDITNHITSITVQHL